MIAQVVILSVFLAAAHANLLLAAPVISTGISKSSRQQDAYGNYGFGYDIIDGKGATNSRAEVGDAHGNVKGSYSLTDIDGRARKVEYVADGHGFRAAVKTNEPGTALSAPAAATIISPYAGPVAPVAVGSVISGPILAPRLIAAPVPIAAYSSVIGHRVAVPASLSVLGHGMSSQLSLLGSPLIKSMIL